MITTESTRLMPAAGRSTANAVGGTLLIGVHDQQHVTGLEGDYKLTGNKGRDGFENWLVGKLVHELGQPAVGSFVEISVEPFDGLDVAGST